ncbi:MAG: NHL repeat-containing protein [Actinobacteria bacterium]|nr:NHL repeat-containing protein [Actinomycetota bacterium]MCL5883610.1 NHL repeat-containing protein [Actinomycetota bacterium]
MQQNKGKLIVLGVLVIALGFTGLLISRKSSEKGKPIAGTSFSLMTTIYDLKTPLGIAIDGDENIYVSDTGNSRIALYDRDGILQFQLGSVTDDKGQELKFYSPYGLAVDDANNKLYVCDYSVRVLDKAGNFLYNLTPPPEAIVNAPGEGAARPNEVAVYKDRVYVTSRDGIYVFDDKGKYITHWGTRGAAVGQFDFPNGITVDPATGNLFVVDTNNWRLTSLTPDGKTRWAIGNWTDANISSPFHLPRSVTVGPNGLLYVSDVPDRILVFDLDGNLKSIIGERGDQDAQLNFPEGLAVSPTNKLYLDDRENGRVQIWQLTDNLPVPGTPEVDKFAKAKRSFDAAGKQIKNTSTTAAPAAGQ